MGDAYFSGKCCTAGVSTLVIVSQVQFGADGVVGGGGGGSGAPWLPIGGSVRVLATHTRLTPTHQSHLTSPPPELLRPKHKAPRSFEWAAFI